MMAQMPRPRPPHLHREVTRHGRAVWYVRVGKGPRIRIKAEFGTPDFDAQYKAAIAGEPLTIETERHGTNTLAWLAARYRQSTAWAELSPATRRQRENVLKHVLASAGKSPIGAITRKAIVAGKDRRRDRPGAARHFIQTMRGLFKWAVEAELAKIDPTEGVKQPSKSTEGHEPWTQEWCDRYRDRWPVGTAERVWFDVIFYTGLRRGDAVLVGRQHVKNGRGSIRAEKNGETAYFRVGPELQQTLDKGPTGDLTYIVGKNGTPLTKESFGNLFRKACKAAGVPGSAHGLRKTRATIEAEKGASEAQLNAMFGWQTGSGMASIYTRKANRERLAFGEPNENIYSRTLSSGAGVSAKNGKKTDA